MRKTIFTIIGGVFLLGLSVLYAQEDSQVQRIKNAFKGQRLLITYREGEVLYGTYYFYDAHFCQSGQYMVFAQSRKRTILDNEQVNNWEEYGTWNVVSLQGQVFLQCNPNSGEQYSYPVRLLPNGQIWIGEGISIQRQGRAECE